MPIIRFQFPGGRYHATPWGSHVNEGVVEWPPSPWRLLRALLAVGFATEGWDTAPPLAESLVRALSACVPSFRVPPALLAQSRHYMPLAKLENGRESTTLVFDTWARVDGPLDVHWETSLTPEETTLLERLVSRMGYLGRAESRVEACLLEPGQPTTAGAWIQPVGVIAPPGPGWEQVALLAPETPQAFDEWRSAQVNAALAQLPPLKAKPTAAQKKERDKALAPFPESLLDALLKDTRWIQDQGWNQPPGARRVLYWRRTDALEVGRPQSTSSGRTSARVPAVLLSMTPPSGNLHVLPQTLRTLPQAELLHRDLVGWLCRTGLAQDAHELLGCDGSRQPLRGHQHSHLLPLDLDGDQHLDHILVWAPGGLGQAAQRALSAVQLTYTKGGAEPLRLAVAMTGALSLLRTLPEAWRDGAEMLLGPPKGATTWTTLTPFVPPRFLKARGKNTLEGQLNAELEQRGLPPARVFVLPVEAQARFRHFVRMRYHGGDAPPNVQGWALRLEFDLPVSGPLCLGYGSHFGLGMFAAEEVEGK